MAKAPKSQFMIEGLLARFGDPDPRVRQNAAESVARIGGAETVPQLLAKLQERDGWVKEAAAQALGLMGDARAVGLLLDLLRYPDRSVRRAAAGALDRILECSAPDVSAEDLRSMAALDYSGILTGDQTGHARAHGVAGDRAPAPQLARAELTRRGLEP